MNELFLAIGMCFFSDNVMQCATDYTYVPSEHECHSKAAELNRANKDIYHARLGLAEVGVDAPGKSPHGIVFGPSSKVKLLPAGCDRNEGDWMRKAFSKKGPFKKGETLRAWSSPIFD